MFKFFSKIFSKKWSIRQLRPMIFNSGGKGGKGGNDSSGKCTRCMCYLRFVLTMIITFASATFPGQQVNALTMQPHDTLQNADQIFIALREASHNNDAERATELAMQLSDYPIRAYVEYFTLKPQLFDPSGHARLMVPDNAVLAFLQKYDGQALADRMRNDYLLVLGARHAWRDFDAQYHHFILDDDLQVKCYALEARLANGENVADAARALLTDARQYGDGCVDLIQALAQQGLFSSDDVWQQIRLAYESNKLEIAKRIADALGKARPQDTLFDMAAAQPEALLKQGVLLNPISHQLALLAIVKLAQNNPQTAAMRFMSIAPKCSSQERAIGWGTIGYRAAFKQLPNALNWYQWSAGAPLSNAAYEWRVRAALRARDWNSVRWAIESMPAAMRNQPAWLYWFGRALKETGDGVRATRYFAQIVQNVDFYGQLAREELGTQIRLPSTTVVTDDEIEQVSTKPGFQLSQRFYALDLLFEGTREWNWTLRGMSDRQLLAAAEYARRLPLYDRVISTAQRTVREHNFSLRYPAPFYNNIAHYANLNGLNVAWAYGLIRQESRFLADVHSGAGAVGLMQIIPDTARTVARKLGLQHFSPIQLADVNTNVLLGTNYLAMVYQQFNGSFVLASASYNAGPHRAQQWQATLTQPIEGAIFVETIPFNETRNYVENVLVNTVYYGAIFKNSARPLKAWLGTIAPAVAS